MLRIKVATLALAAIAFVPGCYQIPVNQGNRLEPTALKRLEIGMTREQVRYLMGTPILQDPFNQSRWNYVWRFKTKSGDYKQRTVILDFTGDILSKITGDNTVFAEPGEPGNENKDAEDEEIPIL